MNYLMIQNTGEIEPEALFLMGASSKRDDNTKIGFFGSGNKYALALLMRMGIPFKVFSGEQEIKFTTRKTRLKDVEFEVIQINGVDTSLTTEMGPQWEPWFIIREIYCNAIDEGGVTAVPGISDDEIPLSGSAGVTRFYIAINEHIKPVCDKWDDYFCFERVDALEEISTYGGKVTLYPNVFDDQRLRVYRKGIMVMEQSVKAAFTYDLDNVPIDEMRLMRDISHLHKLGAQAWYTCKTAMLIEQMLQTINNAIRAESRVEEDSMDWVWEKSQATDATWQIWKNAIGNRIIINKDQSGAFLQEQSLNGWILPYSLCQVINDNLKDITVYGIAQPKPKKSFTEVVRTPKIEYKLKDALDKMKHIDQSPTHPIEIVEFTNVLIGGRAHEGKILLSSTFIEDKSIRDIIKVIMEEQTHLDTGYSDLSREMQNFLFDKWLGALEDKHGIFF